MGDPVEDPQRDEDEHVKDVRDRQADAGATGTSVDVEAVLAEWRRLVRAAIPAAVIAIRQGDSFSASLIDARREVRTAAIAMLSASIDLTATARDMHRLAGRLHQPHEPVELGDAWDHGAVNYTKARAWQACARTLDPTLPEIQRRWRQS